MVNLYNLRREETVRKKIIIIFQWWFIDLKMIVLRTILKAMFVFKLFLLYLEILLCSTIQVKHPTGSRKAK